MAITLAVSSQKQSTDGNATTTASLDTTGATLLTFAIVYDATGGVGTISDSKGNTWVLAGSLTGPASSSNQRVRLYYVKNPTVGTGHTFTGGGTTSFPHLLVAAWSGTNQAANVEQYRGNFVNLGTTLAPGSSEPALADEVFVTAIGWTHSTGTAFTINDGFTIAQQATTVGGQSYGGALGYKIQSGIVTANPTWTSPTSDNMTAAIYSFHVAVAAAGAGGGSVFGSQGGVVN